jgi:hypothetical protein
MHYAHIWAKTLGSDEKVKFEFSISDRYRKVELIVWGIISFVLLLLRTTFWFSTGIITFLIALFYYGYYLRVANAYAFTNKRVLIHRGWLSTHTISVDYPKITDIHITEPMSERFITHTGNLAIITAGSTSDQIVLRHVKDPYEIKKQLDVLKDG